MRLVITLLAILLIVPLAFAATNDQVKISDINVTIHSQSPNPVEPGDVLTLKLKVENTGGETKDDVLIEILPSFPFSMYGQSPILNLGKLPASKTGADAAIIEYELKIDPAAVEGDVGLDLKVTVGTSTRVYNNNEYTIDIQTQDAILEITEVKIEPQQVPPGGTAKVTVMVKNLADSLLRDIKLSLDFDDTTIPLAPHQSSSERRLSLLETDFQNALTFEIIADPDATSGLYKVPMEISYYDEKGNSYSVDDLLAIVVGDTPAVKPFIRRSTVLQANKEGVITLAIANAGVTDVKFLELFILPSEDYELISTSDYYYIGDVDSDDTETEEIDIFVNKRVDLLSFPVRLKYMDANNKPFQQQFDLELELYSSSELKKYGIITGGSGGTIFFLIILAGLGFFWYKKYYKKGIIFPWKKKRQSSHTQQKQQVPAKHK